tara:strand:+ start:29 stop:1048 length:1020 start_codon:yes stop_codon:yes gene_type:complete
LIDKLSSSQSEWLTKQLNQISSSGVKNFSKLRLESSQRDFYRILFHNKKSAILMVVPAGIEESVNAFSKKSKVFRLNDVNVPNIYSLNESLGLILVEDFGDELYQFNLSNEKADLYYDLAINELIKIQSLELDKDIFAYFDEKLLLNNWSLFEDFFINVFLENKIDGKSLETLKESYEKISLNLLNQPQVICHYDFECRNLIFKNNQTGVLDFQDALIGPIGLDLASLFKDLYFFWPEEKILTWYKNYQKKMEQKLELNISLNNLIEFVDYCSIQRQFRILGKLSKVYLDLNRTNRIDDFPVLLNYMINTSGAYKELKPISKILLPFTKILRQRIAKIN